MSSDNTASSFESAASPPKIGVIFALEKVDENAPFVVEKGMDSESRFYEGPEFLP